MMTTNTQQLEIILNEYMLGQLTLAAYRQKRALFIQNYMQHCEKNFTLRKHPGNSYTQQTNTSSYEKSSSITNNSKTNSDDHNIFLKLLFLAVLISLAGIVWYFSSVKSDGQSTIKTSIQRLPNETVVNHAKDSLAKSNELFIFKFIEKDQWDTNSLSDFLVQWKSLSRKQQSEARGGANFIQLSTMLRNRIDEQKALNEIDSRANQQTSLLIWFSTQLSISIK